MKKILSIITLLGMLCLVGCRNEEPQSVAFTVKDISVGKDAQRLNITIEANCPWTITDERNKTFTEIKSGEGTTTTPFVVFSNSDYENKEYKVIVTSEDGTSSDTLAVHQAEAKGIEVKNIEMINAEGGNVDIPVNTNDKVINIITPEWISFTNSRTLSPYIYTFNADPNKTGSPRKGSIEFQGENTLKRISVKQDSYAPTGVNLSSIPDVMIVDITDADIIDSIRQFPICLIPDYADFNKLSMDYQPRTHCIITADYPFINIEFYNKGYQSSRIGDIIELKFYNDGNLIGRKEVRPLFEYFTETDNIASLVGRTIRLSVGELPKEYYQLNLPNDGSITHSGDFLLKLNQPGTHTVTLKSLLTGKEKTITIKASEYIASASAYCKQDIIPWIWTITLSGEVQGIGMSQCASAFIDKSSSAQLPFSKKETGIDSPVNYITNNYSFEIIAYSKEELENKLSSIRFIFEAMINGGKVSGETKIKVEW